MVPGASSGAMAGQQAAGHLCRPRLDSLDANEIPWFVWYRLTVLHSRSEVLPGASARFHPQAHQARVSALSGRDMIPYPAGYAGATGRGASSRSRFPAAFRPSARVVTRRQPLAARPALVITVTSASTTRTGTPPKRDSHDPSGRRRRTGSFGELFPVRTRMRKSAFVCPSDCPPVRRVPLSGCGR